MCCSILCPGQDTNRAADRAAATLTADTFTKRSGADIRIIAYPSVQGPGRDSQDRPAGFGGVA
jgi:hypothetical protein